ncbi:2474_t:CDS:1, partial [Acaulospora colombiana]
MDNSQQQHNTSPHSQQQSLQQSLQQNQQVESANFADPVVKAEHAGDASIAAKETDTKKKRAGPKRRKVTH